MDRDGLDSLDPDEVAVEQARQRFKMQVLYSTAVPFRYRTTPAVTELKNSLRCTLSDEARARQLHQLLPFSSTELPAQYKLGLRP